jgi:hypothetical protein
MESTPGRRDALVALRGSSLLRLRTALRSRTATWAMAAVAIVSAIGCGQPGGTVKTARQLDAEAVAAAALGLYDRNSDGSLDASELAASPGLQAALPRIDADRNKALSSGEIADRFRAYQQQSDLVGLVVYVQRDGVPVGGAEVTMAPDPLQGEGLQSYRAVAADSGEAAPEGESQSIPGIPVGLYTVRIVHNGAEKAVGCEVADDAPSPNRLVVDLDP